MNRQAHLRIQEFSLPPGDEWTSQAAHWWFLYLCAGESYWLCSHSARSLATGEALIIAPAVPAIIRASQLTGTTINGFAFSPEDLLGLFTLAERNSFELELAANSEPVRFLPSAHLVARRLAALVASAPSSNALSQRAEALAIVAAVFDGKASIDPTPHGPGTSALKRFRNLAAEISDMELIDSSPGDLARHCRCSTSYFNRLFRYHFGTSVYARQEELRLFRACQLLRGTESDIAIIAQRCGFENTQTLNLRFKRRFGVWPSIWRQLQRGWEGATSRSGEGGAPEVGVDQQRVEETPSVTVL